MVPWAALAGDWRRRRLGAIGGDDGRRLCGSEALRPLAFQRRGGADYEHRHAAAAAAVGVRAAATSPPRRHAADGSRGALGGPCCAGSCCRLAVGAGGCVRGTCTVVTPRRAPHPPPPPYAPGDASPRHVCRHSGRDDGVPHWPDDGVAWNPTPRTPGHAADPHRAPSPPVRCRCGACQRAACAQRRGTDPVWRGAVLAAALAAALAAPCTAPAPCTWAAAAVAARAPRSDTAFSKTAPTARSFMW